MAKKQQNEVIIATLQQSVVESYISSISTRTLSIYAERIFMRLVKIAQEQIPDVDFKDGSFLRRYDSKTMSAEIDIRIKDLFDGIDSEHYSVAISAVDELMKVQNRSLFVQKDKNDNIIYDKNGDPVYEYESHQLINDAYVNKIPGVLRLIVNPSTWEVLLDFSKGFRRYDLLTAMKLSNPRALSIYKLVSCQSNPITFSISEWKQKFGLSETSKLGSLIKALDKAKDLLDSFAPWSFNYVENYNTDSPVNQGRRGRKTVTSISLVPVHQMKYEPMNSRSVLQVDACYMLGKELYDKLVKYYDFDEAGVKANLPLFNYCKQYFGTIENDVDILTFLEKIAPDANRAATSVQGYVVQALKTHLREKYKISVVKGKIVKLSFDDFVFPKS